MANEERTTIGASSAPGESKSTAMHKSDASTESTRRLRDHCLTLGVSALRAHPQGAPARRRQRPGARRRLHANGGIPDGPQQVGVKETQRESIAAGGLM